MNNTEIVSILNDLIGTCKIGQSTFRKAGERVHNIEFRRLFNIFSQQRAQFIQELDAEVYRLGGQAAPSEGVSSEGNKWNVISMVPTDESTVIGECLPEEEIAVSDYQEALKADLPLDVQYIVKRQYMDIKDAYDRVRILQRAA